jgi:colanic acid biosynthesis glycosyl transferase WcaI
MKLAVLCPHFAPDTAPTGEVVTRIVLELAERGHRIDVVTALPWYRHHRVEPPWAGRVMGRELTDWGSIRRVHPFPTDKASIARRAAAFGAFSVLAGVAGLPGGTVDAVLAMSPPLTLGLTGWATGRLRRAPLVFNVQDVFPDVALELGKLSHPGVAGAARRLERLTYRAAAAITVLSDDLAANVAAKLPASQAHKVRVIPNFVDTEAITPRPRLTRYRRQLGIGDETVVMYAGNVGLSQSLGLMLDAAVAMAGRPDVVFVVQGGGTARSELERQAAGLANVRFGDHQPRQRLAEVLATGDIHVVPLKGGLARSSVPSKTYSILAAGRPVVASVDAGTEVARVVQDAGAGVAVAPEDPAAFTAAVAALVDAPQRAAAMGTCGRRFVERWSSPAAVAGAYEALFAEVSRRSAPGPSG